MTPGGKPKRAGAGAVADAEIGRRLHDRRLLMGLSLRWLSRAVGLTVQDLRDIENGSKRARASLLLVISRALVVPISFFYERPDAPADLPKEPRLRAPTALTAMSSGPPSLKAIRALYKTASPEERERLQALAKLLAEQRRRARLKP